MKIINPIYIYVSNNPQDVPLVFLQQCLHGLYDFYLSRGGSADNRPAGWEALAQEWKASCQVSEIPIASPTAHPVFSERRQRRVEEACACAEDIITQIMGTSNSATASTFSYLSEDWGSFEKGTAVAQRQVDGLGLYFLFPDTVIDEEGRMGQTMPRFHFDQGALERPRGIWSEAPFDCVVWTH